MKPNVVMVDSDIQEGNHGMDMINVKLDDYTKPEIALKAIAKPYRNDKPTLELLKNIVSYGHTSVVEHIVFHFDITGVSRLLLQEFSRHRIASETVESTRFVLIKSIREIDTESNGITHYFVIPELFQKNPALEMFYRKHVGMVVQNIRHMSDLIRELKDSGHIDTMERTSDYLKYMLTEGFRTGIYWTINLRSLANFINLRESDGAHFEIRKLANMIHHTVSLTEYREVLELMLTKH